MIKDIKELNFPAYATLQQATVTINDMGSRSISTQVQISGEIVPDFSYDWEVEFKGERYIHPVRKPQGTKENTSMSAKIDMVFQHWAIYEMKRQYFVEMTSTSAGTAVADKYIASLGLNLVDFVTAFNLVLNHYFGGRIIIKLNPEWQSDPEAKFVSISYSYIWDVLQQVYDIYGVRWTIKTNAEGVCEILMGYPAEEASHIFEYGFEGGLLSVQRQVQSTEIRNRLLGRGGSKNLPYRYFKDKDPNNPLFEADPDWIPELANIAFTELRGKTFRDYVRGWKAKRYGGTPMAEPTEAYLAGYNAEKFDPIEYVDDKESIEKYGILVGALKNNEEIYPSIQGAPGDVDMIVDAEQVTDDDVDSAVENDSVTTNLESGHQTYRNAPANSTVTIETLTKRYFSVPEGKVGNLSMSLTATGKYSDFGDYEETHPILKSDTVKVTIHDKITGAEVKSSSVPVVNIPAGDYYYMISADVETNYDRTSMVTLNIESVYLYTSTPDQSEGWKQTFDIWVRNIWGSSRNSGETDQQYADRVWLPILGDRMDDEARVVFASGWLSFSSDWEFPIVGYAFDDSKTGSHWRLTLAKIDAEKNAGKPFIPYEGYNASAGDRFFFVGIDMPHQYVLWGEERVDDYKRDRLPGTARINPAWVIKADKVRLNQDREGAVLVDSLNAGAQIRLASKQFISGAYESLYVQSMTYNWTADTILYPDVEVVVSDKVHTVKNPVAQMQGSIETLQRQVGSLSNIQQIIRQVCDQLYLRKDGIEDLSKSPTRFLGKVTGEKFRQGQIGGRDWGIYRDENGNAIFEADKLVARQGILVSDLVVNEATYVGGLQINSAAAMKITAVEETEVGYICYFDQQQGSVTNKFKVDDVALCQKFDPEDNEVKFYKRRVIAVAETSVTLSNTDVNGTGVPAIDDEIIHYGNYNDKTRQFVIIRDVIGGGYERMLMGLDSVTSEGFEYYFAGKSADSQARWFVGDSKQYAKYENGQITIKGNLFVTGSDKPITDQIAELDYIKDAFGDGAQGLILGTAVIVGYNDADDKFIPMAGISGVFDKDSKNGGPAAWYGGTTETAKTMFFMDGTGYFASGNIRWDEEGGAEFGGGDLKILPDGSVEFGRNIKITSDGDETLGTILTLLANISDWFTLEDGVLLTKYNLASEKEVSAKGINASQGGGSSYNRLDSWSAYDSTKAGYVLSALLGYDLHSRVTTLENAEVDLSGYYTKEQTDTQISSALVPLQNAHDTLRTEFDTLSNLLSSDTSNYINTWQEVVAFLDGYKDEDDLAAILSGMNADIASRQKKEDFNTWVVNTYNPLATRVGKNETSIEDLEKRLGLFERVIHIDTEERTIGVDYDFYSTEEISAHGLNKGEGGGGGGSSYSRLDTWDGYSSSKAGYVLSAGLGYGLKVAIDELNGYDLDNRVRSIENSYVSKDAGGVVNGGLIVSSLAIAGGSSSQFLKADGSLDGTSYLPTSGGTIKKADNAPLFIEGNVGGSWVGMGFKNDNGLQGFIGAVDDNPVFANKSLTTLHTILHSGNVGSYAPAITANQWATSAEFSGEVGTAYIAYRGGSDWSVTDNGWSNEYTLYHSGNFNPSDYLPTSGGTLHSNSYVVLRANSYFYDNGDAYSRIYIAHDGVDKAFVGWDTQNGTILYNSSGKYLGIKDDGTPYYYSGQGAYNPLLYSSNIGDYALQYYGTNMPSNIVNYVGYGKPAEGWDNFGPAISFGYGAYYAQMQMASNGSIFSRISWEGSNSDWKTIAFTDSDITGNAGGLMTGASHLYAQHNDTDKYIVFGYQTARNGYSTTIDGTSITFRDGGSNPTMLINSAGNVTIGNKNYAGTGYKLFVDGTSYFSGAVTIAGTLSARGIATNWNDTWSDGTNSNPWYGLNFNPVNSIYDVVLSGYYGVTLKSAQGSVILNSNGNVTIGAEDKAGASAKLYVDGKIYAETGLLFNGDYGIWKANKQTAAAGDSDILYYAPRHFLVGGNVLIGTTSDNGAKLQVEGGVTTKGYIDITEQNSSNIFTLTNYSNIARIYAYDGTNDVYRDIYIGQNSGNALVVTGGGNVGIGITDPQARLDVNGKIKGVNFEALSTININRNGNNGVLYDTNKLGFEIEPYGTYVNLKVYNQSNALVSAIRMTTNGGVGIGNIDPSATLDVNGTLKAGATTLSSLSVSSDIVTDRIIIGGVTLSTEDGVLKIESDMYATGEISAHGLNKGESGGGGSSYSRLDTWIGYDSSKAGYVLSAGLGYDLKLAVDELNGYNLNSRLTTVESNYLSKNGGTINGTIKIHNVAGAYNSVIEFSNTSSYLGALGVSSYNRPVFYNGAAYEDILTTSGGTVKASSIHPLTIDTYGEQIGIYFSVNGSIKTEVGWDGSNGAYLYNYITGDQISLAPEGGAKVYVNRKYENILHTGNIGDYALSTSGGTINSNTYDILTLDTSYPYGDARIHIKVNGESKSLFGWSSSFGTMIYNTVNGYSLSIKDDGTPLFNNNTLIHSGNIGSQSVASATKLATARTIWGQSFDGTGDVSGVFYDVSGIEFLNPVSNKYLIIGQGFALNGMSSFLDGNNVYLRYGTATAIGFILNSSGNVTIGASDLAGSGTKLYVDGGIRFAPRTIWGQSFDGTDIVDGDLHMHTSAIYFNSDKTNYNMSCNGTTVMTYDMYGGHRFCTYGAGQRMFINHLGNVTIGDQDYASNYYKLYVTGSLYAVDIANLTDLDIRNISDANYIFAIRMNTNGVYLQSRKEGVGYLDTILNNNGGNVGIGTDNPTCKLHVNGSLSAGATTLSSLTVSGLSTFTGGVVAYDIHGNGQSLYLGNASNNAFIKVREDMQGSSSMWSIPRDGKAVFTSLKSDTTLTVTGASTLSTVSASSISTTEMSVNGQLTVYDRAYMKDIYPLSNNDSWLGYDGLRWNNIYSHHLNLSGTATMNTIKIKAGQSIQFEDSSGNLHTLKYDSTKQAFVFDGNVNASGEMSAHKLNA